MEPTAQTMQVAPTQRKRSGFAIIVGYAAACGLVFLVELLPPIGFILLIFLPLWFAAVFHLAMLHLTIAALLHSIERVWLAVPATIYAMGIGLYLFALNEVKGQAAAIDLANAAARMKVDSPLVLTVEGQFDPLYLLSRYRVDRLIHPSMRRNDGLVRIDYYAHGPACGSRDLFPDYKGPGKTQQCLLSEYGPPVATAYRVKGEQTNANGVLVQRFSTQWTVFDGQSGARLVSVEAAEFNTILPVLVPMAFCGPIGMIGPWVCTAGLKRSSSYIKAGYPPDTGSRRTALDSPFMAAMINVARALSLDPRLPTDQ